MKPWVPIDKDAAKHLPFDRPYTELEALFSVSLDIDNNNPVTVSGYASLWTWSRRRVKTFLDGIGVEIVYKSDTKSNRNQSGHIVIHKTDINRTYNGHITAIKIGGLDVETDINRTYNGHKPDIKRYTTIEPKPKPEPNPKPRKENLKKKKSQIDPDMVLSDDLRKYALERGMLDRFVDECFESFKLYHVSKGSLMANWSAAWQTWARNAKEITPKYYGIGGKDDYLDQFAV